MRCGRPSQSSESTPRPQPCSAIIAAKNCGGASRIKDHIIEACTCETNAFLDLKQKLIEAKDEAKDAKQQKLASAELDVRWCSRTGAQWSLMGGMTWLATT